MCQPPKAKSPATSARRNARGSPAPGAAARVPGRGAELSGWLGEGGVPPARRGGGRPARAARLPNGVLLGLLFAGGTLHVPASDAERVDRRQREDAGDGDEADPEIAE